MSADPEASIVIPAVNEELTISDFVDWCMQGLAEAGVQGEVLIVDSSTDRTAQIALERGARVLKTPKRGLAGHTSMPCRTFVVSTSSWETRTARTISDSWRLSSTGCGRATSLRWVPVAGIH